MSLSYADEKFSNAVRSLATSPGAIHERLIEAIVYHISHVDAQRDMPKGLQVEFEKLMDRLTKDSPDKSQFAAGEGKIHASVRKLSIEEAVEVAEEILALTYRIKSYYDEKPAA